VRQPGFRNFRGQKNGRFKDFTMVNLTKKNYDLMAFNDDSWGFHGLTMDES